MSIDAAGTKYWTGRGGVVLVNDPIETVERVARAYDIRWLVLDGERQRARPRRRSSTTTRRPAWLGDADRRCRDDAEPAAWSCPWCPAS